MFHPWDGVFLKILVLVTLETHFHEHYERPTQNKSYHIAHRVDKQGARPSVSNQAWFKKLATGSKSPINNGQEGSHTRPLLNNGPSIINTKNITKNKNTEQKWSYDEYHEVIVSYYTATFFPSRKSNTIETYKIWRKKNPPARPNMDPNKLATMPRTIIKKQISFWDGDQSNKTESTIEIWDSITKCRDL